MNRRSDLRGSLPRSRPADGSDLVCPDGDAPRRKSRRRDAGVGLLEVLVSTAVIVTVLLGHVVSIVLNHTASVDTQERALALVTAQRFVERMRADTDFEGLYARLRPGTAESDGDAGLTRLGSDLALPAYAASTYYADFVPPAKLGTCQILVQVPTRTVSGVAALRENLVAPRYGLPADLNGDGAVDGASKNADYLALPVVVRVRWSRAGRSPREIVLATWLRSGE